MSDKEEYERLKKKLYPKMEQKLDNTTITSLYFLSFIIPVVGFIVGAIYASNDERHYKLVGRNCLVLSACNVMLVGIWLLGIIE